MKKLPKKPESRKTGTPPAGATPLAWIIITAIAFAFEILVIVFEK